MNRTKQMPMSNPPRRQFNPKWLALYPLLAIGALAALIPFLWAVSTSLKEPADVFAYPPQWIPRPFEWSNYRAAFNIVSGRTFVNSFIFATSIVICQGIVTTMGAFAFARLKFPLRDQIFLLYLGTMMIPPQVTMIPTFLVVVKLGWINTYQGLIIPIVAQGAFGTFMFRQFFSKIPNELYESARLDGASPLRLYWDLTLPLSRPVMTAYAVITFLTAWNMYLWPLIVVRSTALKVVPMAIAELASGSQERGIQMAAVSLSILPILLLYAIGQRWFVEGIAMTGMKG